MYRHRINLINFYKNTIKELKLINTGVHNHHSLHNRCHKIIYNVTYDNKQMILLDDNYYNHSMSNEYKLSKLVFHPLDENRGLCSHLLIEDSIHINLSESISRIFRGILETKLGMPTYLHDSCEHEYIEKLPDSDMNTIYKWFNLYSIASATSFSRNIISFSFDLINTQSTQVNFTYPLYHYLKTIHGNTFFGIHLKDSEIELFKQIYKDCIIDCIKKLFAEPIVIPYNSNKFPKFYILMRIHLKIKKLFIDKYNIDSDNADISKLNDEINILNMYAYDESNTLEIPEQVQELDQESYKNELQIRKEYSPNWLLLKDSIVEENLKDKQVIVDTDKDKNIVIDKFKRIIERNIAQYNSKIHTFIVNKNVDNFIKNYQKNENDQEWKEIFYWQTATLNMLYVNGGNLWFDTRIDKYYFRSKVGGNIVTKNRNEISELLTRALKESISSFLNSNSNVLSAHAIEIVLLSKINAINNQILKSNEKADNVIKIFLFENAIPAIDDDRFDTQSSFDFIKHDRDLLYTRNRFIPTKYLIKRFNNPLLPNNNLINYGDLFTKNEKSYLFDKNEHSKPTIDYTQLSFIEQFIFYLVNEDCHVYYYVMNWLSCFFNSLEKSGTALVLLGDQEVTQNIFWDKIIKEIFGLQYCITINDEECDTASSFDIAKDKLFFHIGDIVNAETKFDDQTLYKIVKDLLVKPSISKVNENNELEETIVHGQMIVTAKNPLPYIKRAMSKCTIIKVNDMDTIIEKLVVPDEVILEDRIQKDLDNFANILRSLSPDHMPAEYAMDTKDRKVINNNKSPNINKEDIDNKIDAFIQAIKTKDIDYFVKVKDIDDSSIYKHLKNAFNQDEGYFIGQDLFIYYNAIHEQKFKIKKEFADKLKEKDRMFQQEVKTLKILTVDEHEEVLFQSAKTTKEETGSKELYKINGYRMAKDISIPYGAIIISSQDNIKKYTHANPDNAIKIHKEYKERKAIEKKKK